MDETKRQAMMSLAETENQHIRSHEISDFRILTLEGDTLRLAGSFDLSYYHDVELTITGVSWLDLPTCFWLDLSLSEPFALTFPAKDAVSLQFTDCGAGRQGAVCFEGDLSFHTGHVSYTPKPGALEDAP